MSTTGETTIKFIEMLLNESAALLIRHGETRADAERLAQGFVLSYSQKVSGQKQLYFRKGLKIDAQVMRDTIRAEFWAGSTVFELSDKYNLSTARIYQIIKQKEPELTETDTSLKAPLMIEAVRMLLKAGVEKEDSIRAARGLTAVILTRFSGIIISMPKPAIIKTIIGTLPAAAIVPDGSELPKIRTRLFTTAANFSGYAEINTLLKSATEQISRAEEIIAKLKGG